MALNQNLHLIVRQHIVAGLRTSNIPHVEFESIVHEGFDIEALRRHDMRYIFI